MMSLEHSPGLELDPQNSLTMPSFGEVQKNNTSLNLSFVPIAIFAGGTSGIGRATAEAFAHSIQGNAHIILLGRNKTAAANILSNLPKPSLPGAVHEFVECDLSLMKNVEEVTNNLRSRLPRLNYLVLSSGTLNFYGRDETTEGIDKKLAVAYYARWKLIQGLTSLLQKAKDEGQDASVLSVLAPTSEGRIDFDDLGLKKNYGASTYMSSSATYNDLMLEVMWKFLEKRNRVDGVSRPSLNAIPSSRSHISIQASCAHPFWVTFLPIGPSHL